MKKRLSAKNFTAFLICAGIILSSGAIVFADENESEEEVPVDVAAESIDEEDVSLTEQPETDIPADVSDVEEDAPEAVDDEEPAGETLPEDIPGDEINIVESDPDYFEPIDLDYHYKKSIIPDDMNYQSPSYGTVGSNEGLYRTYYTGVEAKTYDILSDSFADIASGNTLSTKIYISVEDLGMDNIFTAEELDLEYIFKDGAQNPALGNAVFNAMTCELRPLINRLLVDYPYECYWWDKTHNCGCGMSYTKFQLKQDSNYNYYIYYVGGVEYFFPAAEAYADQAYYDADEGDTYMLLQSQVNRANTSYANAQAIVNKYSNLSDLEKLTKYKEEICSLTDYNTYAASHNIAYGDPWNWVYVFDGDPGTTVVCEGYSKAFKILCDLTDFDNYDISCILVSGDCNGAHMWNILSFGDGMNYLVDVTNCDNGTIGYPDKLFIKSYTTHPSIYTYTYSFGLSTMTYSYYDKTYTVFSNDALSITSAPLQNAPGLALSSSCEGITLNWDAVSGAVSYDIYRRDKYSMWDYVGYTTNTTYKDVNANNNTQYYYCVRSINSSKEYMNPVDNSYSITFNASHTIVVDDAVAADCTHSGLTEGSHCEVCGKVLVAQEVIPATGHNEVVDPGIEATCQNSGLTAGVHCSTCGESLIPQYVVPALKNEGFLSVTSTNKSIILTWDELIGATAYEVYKRTSTGSWELLTTTNDLSYIDTELDFENYVQYYCVQGLGSDNKAHSPLETDGFCSFIHISNQPGDYTGPLGNTAYFNVEAYGSGLKYQWQINKGTGWQNTSISGNKTKTLSVGVLSSRNGFKFRCIITDSYGKTVISDEATMSVTQSLEILSQPADYTGYKGDTAVFNVSANGNDLTYQWQINKGNGWQNTTLSGSKTSSLSVGIMTSRNGFKFRCIITDAYCNSVTSDEAVLIVAQPVSITKQPVDYSGPKGDVSSFEIEAIGDGLSYQWQINKGTGWINTSLSGNKTSILSVDIMSSRNGFKFRCLVSDNYGVTLISNEVILSVSQNIYINIQPADYTGTKGETAIFTVEAVGDGLTYQWQINKGNGWQNTSIAGNKTPSLSVGVMSSRNGFKFRCVITDSRGRMVTSNDAILHVI